MLNKDFLAVKELSKLRIDGKTYFRIVHHLGKLITNITIFELIKDSKSGELSLTELLMGDVPNSIQQKIMSNEYEVDVKNDDKSLIVEALKTKLLVIKSCVEDHINVSYKRRLMQLIEVGGHYFGFVFEDGMPYTKLYHMHMDTVKDELFVSDVPPEMLPALFEALSPTILGGASDLTIQVGEGVYARISTVDRETALVTVVVATENDNGESQLKLLSGFTLLRLTESEWVATVVPDGAVERIKGEMKESFEIIYRELLLKVFEVNPEEALKGL